MRDYELKEFGLPELDDAGNAKPLPESGDDSKLSSRLYAPRYDKLDTTTILSILVAFTIPLFTDAFRHYADLTVATSFLFGALVLIFFMLYTVDYYEKIWVKWFALPNDFAFFRVYSLVTGVIVIALMNVVPQFWYWYISALFLLLSWKKYKTKNQYQKAFDAKYGSVNRCPHKVRKATYFLAENMSRNFRLYGFILSLPVSAALTLAYYWPSAELSVVVLGRSFSGNVVYIGTGSVYAAVLVGFWYKKVRGGINYMVEQVEAGNFEFFEKENR